MRAWTDEELDRISEAQELHIAPRRSDGSLRRPLPIWVVRVGDQLFVRSWRGTGGSWYRAACATRAAHISAGGVEQEVELLDPDGRVDDAVDAAYRTKYAHYPQYVEPMIAPPAQATTLKLVPSAR